MFTHVANILGHSTIDTKLSIEIKENVRASGSIHLKDIPRSAVCLGTNATH